ncbi:uncharacterized protein LOC143241101 isoform X2 [Tachypleus tridentatus]|uniref:uncharacterized protein LOC143241101 isoform X2 n=1 Tax=Tachypleus tridentatus TaxID=6853 RepID=UPI003FD2C19D
MDRSSLHYAMWIEATRRLVIRTGIHFAFKDHRQRPPHLTVDKLWKRNIPAFLPQQSRKRRRKNNRRWKCWGRSCGKRLRSVVSWPSYSVKESHQMAEVDKEKNNKLKGALSMCEYSNEDRPSHRQEKDQKKYISKNHKKRKKCNISSSESSYSSTSSSDSLDSSQFSSDSTDKPDSSSDSGSKQHKQKCSKHVKKGASHNNKKKTKKVRKLVKEGKHHRKQQEYSNKLSRYFSLHVPLCPKSLPHFIAKEHSQSARKHDYGINACVKQTSSKRDRLNLGDMMLYKQEKLNVFCSNSEEKETRKKKKKRRKSSSSCVQELNKKKNYNKHHSKRNERKCCINNNKVQKSQEKNKTEERKKSATHQMQQHQHSHFPISNSQTSFARSQSEAVSASNLNLKGCRRKKNRNQDETTESSLPEQGKKKAEKLKNYSIISPQFDYQFYYRKGEADYISVRKSKDPSPIGDKKETYPYAQEVIKYHKSHSISHIGKSDELYCSSSLPSLSSLQAIAHNTKKFAKSHSEVDRSQQTVSQGPKAQTKIHFKSLLHSTLQSGSSSKSQHFSGHSKSRTSSSRRSPSIPKRRGSPSFLEKRRITRFSVRSKSRTHHHQYSCSHIISDQNNSKRRANIIISLLI